MIFADSNVTLIVAIVIAAVVVIFGGFFLYYFVLSRKNIKRQVSDLERKYSYLDALLVGQDSQYIHRLEIISRTNLLYVEKYNSFSHRFKEIFEGEDKFCESMIKQLNALVANKQFKNIKIVINDTKKSLVAFENKVNKLDADLFAIIKPEEEARHSILKLKEDYRRVKQIYYANSADLELAGNAFNQVFEKLDRSFSNFESHIESGEYEDANALIPLISRVVGALDNSLSTMPNLCILCETILPNKIKELTNEYHEVEKQGVPLFNLSFRQKVDKWNFLLDNVRHKLMNLETSGVNDKLDEITREIEETREMLHSEIDDETDFNKSSDILYRRVIELEKSFLKICSVLPEVEKFYIIDEEHRKQIDELKEHMSQLGASKRNLDNYTNSAIKQPYSVLKKKLDVLNQDYEVSYKATQEFKTYLDSLKTTSEEAYSMVFVYYYHCRQVESILRQIGIPSLKKKYNDAIENIYNLLNEIDIALKSRPIDVAYVSERAESLKSMGNEFFDDIENKYRESQLAESAIVYANRDRNHQRDVHQQLTVLEEEFFTGEFLKVYHDVNDLYQRNHVEEETNVKN